MEIVKLTKNSPEIATKLCTVRINEWQRIVSVKDYEEETDMS